MSSFVIKIIAVITMVVDHLGLFMFPQLDYLRVIGRLSFPLFAWSISNGAKHTKNINAYLARLFAFGTISQIPYFLLYREVNIHQMGLNIFFTLFLGLLSIKIWRSEQSKTLRITEIILISAIGQLINVSYGAVGILSIVFFYIFEGNFRLCFLSQFFLYVVVWFGLMFVGVYEVTYFSITQPAALFSLLLIYQYNGEQGIKAKYLFYLFYPLHLLMFYLIK